HPLPIGKKLQVINLLIVGLITVLTLISLCFYMYSTLRDDYLNNSKTLSSVLAESVTSALLFGDQKAAQESLAGLRTVDYVAHAELYDKSGNLFTHYARTETFKAPATFSLQNYQQDIHFGSLIYDNVFPVFSIAADREQIGTITLQLDLSKAYTHFGYQVGALLLIGLLGAALVSATLYKLQKSITVPLLSLAETMRKVGQDGNLSPPTAASGQDEIGELANVFNHMVDELSQREQSLQQELKERRRIEAKLSQIAHFDTTTNLPNRHSFNNQIDRALLNYKYELEKFSLMYIDLDNFKYVNDTFGHHVGDLLLSHIGERLRSSLRQKDFIARLGGDEFVIIVNDFTDQNQISAVAEKILVALQAPFSVENHEIFIGASIGIAICPNNGNNSEALQRQADSAMYQAKNMGKNNFQFYKDDLSRTQKNRINIESHLRHALERNEITVYYQPIVEISNEKIIGFEALVRWIRPDGSITRPDDFIPLAEEIGLIIDIGKYVLMASAAQTAIWVNRFGLSFTAVNFSSRQFKHNNLAEDIFSALNNAQLEPCNFEMEITESVLMDNSIDSMNLLELLIQKGMGIAIDDFGTGYSSLSYITSFPISKIKIDQSFVAKLPDDKNALAVVTAIIGLAKSLNLKVVAEGIETAEQLDCLSKLGCQYGQGYLFSKPIPANEATRLLESRATQPTSSSINL
ncbi:MAG: EAL domain-containing protein, partial [Gallionellaceae bacterium]|nr:EAL domain-containing protein [Gallionellaceae bacterium]